MIHEEKTTELTLPGFRTEEQTAPRKKVASPLAKPSDWGKSDTQISVAPKSTMPLTVRLLLVSAVLFLSVLMLSGF